MFDLLAKIDLAEFYIKMQIFSFLNIGTQRKLFCQVDVLPVSCMGKQPRLAPGQSASNQNLNGTPFSYTLTLEYVTELEKAIHKTFMFILMNTPPEVFEYKTFKRRTRRDFRFKGIILVT